MCYVTKTGPHFFFLQIKEDAHTHTHTHTHTIRMYTTCACIIIIAHISLQCDTDCCACHQIHSYQTATNERQVPVLDPPQGPETKLPKWGTNTRSPHMHGTISLLQNQLEGLTP